MTPASEPVRCELDGALARFVSAMRAKFEKRAERNPETNVVVHGKSRLELRRVEGHLRAEMVERLEAVGDEEITGEDIDVANLAFLDWWLREPPTPKEVRE